MGPDYGVMMVIVSAITLITLLLLFVRNNYWKAEGQLAKPVTLQEVLRDFVAYVLMFTSLSFVLRALLCLVCSSCESC
jgi:hypothetical protein